MALTRSVARRRSRPSDVRLADEAAGWLAVLRLALAVLPSRGVASMLGLRRTETTEPLQAGPGGRTATRVGWAVRAAVRRTPTIIAAYAPGGGRLGGSRPEA